MLEARLVEGPADRADPPVHHVGRRDHVAAGLGLDQRLADQDGERRVVDDVAVLEQAVMAVGRVGVEGDVADHAELRQGRLDRAHRPADQVVGVGRLPAVGGLQRARA